MTDGMTFRCCQSQETTRRTDAVPHHYSRMHRRSELSSPGSHPQVNGFRIQKGSASMADRLLCDPDSGFFWHLPVYLGLSQFLEPCYNRLSTPLYSWNHPTARHTHQTVAPCQNDRLHNH